MRLVTPTGVFDWVPPDSEAEFEKAIKANSLMVFGENRHYIECKRRISRGTKSSIPDAYLIDLARTEPRLYFVENELIAHDPFKHIGVQLLEFSHAHSQSGRQLKAVLFDEINKYPEAVKACETYATANGYRNLDNLLDYLVFEAPFQVIVIIDEDSPELQSVLKQFSFPKETIEFVTYEDNKGRKAYRFNPFLQDVSVTIKATGKATDVGELDTIVVPARNDGFNETFIGENRWYEIRIHGSMIPQIKHIAAYRVAPISAITHIASVNRIVPWKDTGKYCLEFAEPAHEIGPIKLDPSGKGLAPQAPRYTSMNKLMKAKVLSDIY
ncbi:hypothetical protein ACFLWS_03865 [Chloroflexota bacterium]